MIAKKPLSPPKDEGEKVVSKLTANTANIDLLFIFYLYELDTFNFPINTTFNKGTWD
jgi:hypothetical protein